MSDVFRVTIIDPDTLRLAVPTPQGDATITLSLENASVLANALRRIVDSLAASRL